MPCYTWSVDKGWKLYWKYKQKSYKVSGIFEHYSIAGRVHKQLRISEFDKNVRRKLCCCAARETGNDVLRAVEQGAALFSGRFIHSLKTHWIINKFVSGRWLVVCLNG